MRTGRVWTVELVGRGRVLRDPRLAFWTKRGADRQAFIGNLLAAPTGFHWRTARRDHA